MKFLTFDQIKAQLRLDDQQAEDERTLLEMYGTAAEELVLDLIRRTEEELLEEYGEMPKRIIQAALIIVAQSYQHREVTSQQNMSIVPYTFDLLIKPFMRLADKTE